MAYAYNFRIQETGTEAGGSHVRGQSELHTEKLGYTEKLFLKAKSQTS